MAAKKVKRNREETLNLVRLTVACRRPERDVADDLQLEAFERGDARRMIREQQDTTQAQLVEYLRADAVVAVRAVTGLEARLLLRQPPLVHKLVGAELVDEVEVVLPLA